MISVASAGPLRSQSAAIPVIVRSALLNTGLFSCIINLLMLTGPLFMLQVYDRVLTSRSLPTLVALTLLVAALFTFMGLLELVRSRILVRIGQRVDEEFGDKVFDQVITHALLRTPNIEGQPLRDLDSVRQFISGPGPFALFDAPWVPVYLAVIYLMHPWMGMLATVGAVLLLVFAVINEMATRKPMAEAAKTAMDAQSFADECRRNAEVIGAMGMLASIRRRWKALHDNSVGIQINASDRGGTVTSSSKAMRMFLQSAMLALGAFLAVGQEITPGTMIAGSIIMSRALAPLEQAITQWRGFLSFRGARQRLNLVLGGAGQTETLMPLPEPVGSIAVEHLIVTAPQTNKTILQDINFDLDPGQALGVIGPTAAGKTTLARALVGVWPLAKGVVRLDGAPFDQWPAEQIGAYIGYLPQDVELFAGTVEENISRFHPEPDPEAIVEAAKHANVHELILNLPDGYNTTIGEGGSVLSAGQRQRVALARALYNDPVFVVLDEPNANLDAEGEAALSKAIRSLKKRGCTVVVVAHRPGAVSDVDLLLFLREGRQQAFGPRDEVLAQVTEQPRSRRVVQMKNQSRRNVPSGAA